ncbi:hypothetical protein DYBT9623_01351 [Dyadobacter sp. CECT 9623]|uniref:Uncharacterized protein n=1 Tax=Dyadobacter linearis TaxID=2823330 RepID=A0ABM8UMP1_9BACT|nr:hypothetical protein [Dyadobacter sp. CECT 9623]CAG5068619.1 hypothetical protein DYBT9623_01351 [Dyadobacter sp. CECT 9623]
MKRILLLVLICLLFSVSHSDGQAIPSTGGHSICKCLPNGWSHWTDNGGYLSSTKYFGSVDQPFISSKAIIPGQPVLPPIPSGASAFIGVQGGGVKAEITGLVIGQKYKFTYNIISARLQIDPDYPDKHFTSLAQFRIRQGGGDISQYTHSFSLESDENVWKPGVFEFTSIATTATLVFTDGEEAGNYDRGVVGLDLGPNAVSRCVAGVTAVPLKATTHEITCPETATNLITTFFGGLKPAGTEIRFFDNPTHTGLPLSNLNVGAGTYYAFYYDAVNNCYNQDVSTAKVEVTYRNCADLTPTIDIDALNFNSSSSRDFVINLYEINGGRSQGPVTVKITKPGGFTISYPTVSGTSKVFGGTANENSKWQFSENAGFITITSSEPITANGQSTIGFSVSRKPGVSKDLSQSVTVTLVGGAGGELNTENNLSITGISTN